MNDFFISYTSADRSWAEWIAWELEAAGYSTVIQAWDFRPGENFVVEMQKAASEATRTVLVLSEDYLKSSFAQSEWAAAFAQDPTGNEGRIVPVCVRACQPAGVLRAIIFIDLVGLDESAARERLLEGIQAGRSKPEAPPPYPGEEPKPAFPGAAGEGEEPAPGPSPLPAPPAPPTSLLRRTLVRGAAAYVVATGLVLLASWVGLLSVVGADDWLERHFLVHMQRFLPPPAVEDIVLLRGAADGGPLGKPGPGWRAAHAELVDALSQAGTRVIVFDLDFEARSASDAKLAEAIGRAAARNTAVVLGARGFEVAGTKARPRMSPILADLPVRWGTLWGDPANRRIELARRLDAAQPAHRWIEAETVPVVPSLALQAVMQHGAGPARAVAAVLRPRQDTIEIRATAGEPLRTIPVVDAHLNFIVDVSADFRSHSYQEIHAQRDDPQALSDFAGKVVVIGYEEPDEVWTTTGGKPRYKMEVQASAIAQILHGAFLRRPRPAYQYAVILLMGAVGWLLRTRLHSWTRHTLELTLPAPLGNRVKIPTAFVVALVVYGLVAFAACKVLRIVPRFTYDLAALLLTYVTVGWAARRPSGSRFPATGIGPAVGGRKVA